MSNRIVCSTCCKQVVSYPVSMFDERRTSGPVTLLVGDKVMCVYCSREADLDENGLYPEEAAEARDGKS